MGAVHFAIFASLALFIIAFVFACYMMFTRRSKGSPPLRFSKPAESPGVTFARWVATEGDRQAYEQHERELISRRAVKTKADIEADFSSPKDPTPPPAA